MRIMCRMSTVCKQQKNGSKKDPIRRTKDGLRVKVGQVEEFKEPTDDSDGQSRAR